MKSPRGSARSAAAAPVAVDKSDDEGRDDDDPAVKAAKKKAAARKIIEQRAAKKAPSSPRGTSEQAEEPASPKPVEKTEKTPVAKKSPSSLSGSGSVASESIKMCEVPLTKAKKACEAAFAAKQPQGQLEFVLDQYKERISQQENKLKAEGPAGEAVLAEHKTSLQAWLDKLWETVTCTKIERTKNCEIFTFSNSAFECYLRASCKVLLQEDIIYLQEVVSCLSDANF